MATNSGLLFIADITGYTAYLADTELEHAHAILADLLQLLVSNATPPLVISRLEGDAVVAYALDGGYLNGRTFVERVEATYAAFRQALQLMAVNTTCPCRACANISALDLKFFVHHGTFVLQRIGDHTELVGPDVNLIFRLVKNGVTAETGIRAYTLYTDDAARSLGIDGAAAGWLRHDEEPQDVGPVTVWVQDMAPAWEAARERSAFEFTQAETILDAVVEVSVPQPVMWDYVTDSEFRGLLLASDRQEVSGEVGGRLGEGSTFVCYHGDKVVPQLIVEWAPFRHLVTKDRMPLPVGTVFLHSELTLEPTAAGTSLRFRLARMVGPAVLRMVARRALSRMAGDFDQDLVKFARAVEEHYAARPAVPAAP